MKNKISNIIRIIYPYNKINLFVILLFLLGIVFGSVFGNIISLDDKKVLISTINGFMQNINSDSLMSFANFKNSIFVNATYLSLIFLLCATFLGLILGLIVLFFKGFTIGFVFTSFIITYNFKGVILSFLYILFGQLINIFSVCTLAIYSIIFAIRLFQNIFKSKNNDMKKFLRNFTIIYVFLMLISFFSSFLETYIFPKIIKFIIKLFL